jgi:hypothetical protein
MYFRPCHVSYNITFNNLISKNEYRVHHLEPFNFLRWSKLNSSMVAMRLPVTIEIIFSKLIECIHTYAQINDRLKRGR